MKLSEREARLRYPGLVVASLGAQRKEKPNGEISARVLFDGTNGIHVNKKTRVRDQERSPIASDVKRYMREKSTIGEKTFALTADIKEAKYLGVKSGLGVPFTSIRSAPSASPQPRTGGRGLPQHWAARRSMFQARQLLLGIFSSRMTSI